MEAGKLSITKGNNILRLRFSHPKANSLPLDLLVALRDAIRDAAVDDEIRVISLASEGDGAFCAGASFEEFERLSTETEATAFFQGFADVILAMRDTPKFIVARVQGKVVGGGLGLIAAADYAQASNVAAVRLSEYSLDIGPFTIAPALERKIGLAAYSAMTIDTSWRTAAWAKDNGLFSDVFESGELLDQGHESLLSELSARSPNATTELKAMFWEGTSTWPTLLAERAKTVAKLLIEKKKMGS